MIDARQDHTASGRGGPDGRCLIFLHLEKTAGSTVNSILGVNYPRDRSIRINALDKSLDQVLGSKPPTERASAQLVRGHMPYGAHLHIQNRCEYITVLRDPVSRVVSKYKHILRGTIRQPMRERVLHEEISLEEYVESGMDTFQTENYQTRLLSGRHFDAPDQKALKDAKDNLERFLLVGLSERFEETLALLRRTLRLRIPFYITRNVAPPLEPSKRALEIIGERNQLDLRLYEFAEDLFAEHLSRQTRSFPAEVSVYKAWRPLSRFAARGERLVRALSGSRSHTKAGR